MHFSIHHVTRYRYSRPVFCEPLTVRLRPRTDHRQRLLRFTIEFEPASKGRSHAIDLEGNEVTIAWFAGSTESLTVTTAVEAETDDVNPFHFLLKLSAT